MTIGMPRAGVRRAAVQLGFALAAVIAAGLGIHALVSGAPAPQPEARAARVPPVEVVEVSRGARSVEIVAWGVVEAARRVAVSPEVGGRLTQVSEKLVPGRVVDAGQVLGRLDDASYALEVRRREADLARAQADLTLERGNRRVAEAEAASIDETLSAEERDLVLRGPQMRAAEAAVMKAEADLAGARLDLERTVVTSPFRGVVLAETAAPGRAVSAGEGIAEIAALDRFHLEVKVSSADLRWLRGADDGAVSVVVDAPEVWPSGRTRPARFSGILPEVSETGRMARVLLDIPDPLDASLQVLVGDYLRARIRVAGPESGVRVPEAALRGGDSVWVVDADGRLEVRAVRVLRIGERGALIDAGLSGGERVVVSRLDPVVPGMRVEVRAVTGDGA
jgi:RND family efflux transporter MFP subunit